ncbi:unnamed protein product [Parascedosporium putredinis]|uniref:Uncharacterized protein n=1 Tax=Parascedosporium putredinis TaxID=1442378 RepID=A0A9P1M9D5_9PEZI|nr:unnamed protein product [Parascedosporium putredinis]CAI7994632.1 unnamed protein product [Parascedosporium putredinis]
MPKLLGISLSDSRTASSVSVVDVAAVMEKPGIKTPSRKSEFEAGHREAEEDVASESGDGQKPVPIIKVKKALPEVPKHRHGVPFQQRATLHVNGTKRHLPRHRRLDGGAKASSSEQRWKGPRSQDPQSKRVSKNGAESHSFASIVWE